MTQREKGVAQLVPATREAVAQPHFLVRAQAVWGDHPSGKPLSAVVAEARGGLNEAVAEGLVRNQGAELTLAFPRWWARLRLMQNTVTGLNPPAS